MQMDDMSTMELDELLSDPLLDTLPELPVSDVAMDYMFATDAPVACDFDFNAPSMHDMASLAPMVKPERKPVAPPAPVTTQRAPRAKTRTRRTGRKRKQDAVTDKTSPARTTVRRLTHNASEQRRVKRINEQVSKLRTILNESSRPTKSDKCSVLAASVEYVEELKNEVETLQSKLDKSTAALASAVCAAPAKGEVNYQSVFRDGGVAQVVSSPSGAFLDCNDMFCEMSGFKREDITKFTMFNLTHPTELPSLYAAVGQLLSGNGPESLQFTKTCIMHNQNVEAYIVMKMIRDSETRQPSAFVCSVLPLRNIARPVGEPAPMASTASVAPKEVQHKMAAAVAEMTAVAPSPAPPMPFDFGSAEDVGCLDAIVPRSASTTVA